jgi:hypothetical protein
VTLLALWLLRVTMILLAAELICWPIHEVRIRRYVARQNAFANLKGRLRKEQGRPARMYRNLIVR